MCDRRMLVRSAQVHIREHTTGKPFIEIVFGKKGGRFLIDISWRSAMHLAAAIAKAADKARTMEE